MFNAPHPFTPGEYTFDMAVVVLGVRCSVLFNTGLLTEFKNRGRTRSKGADRYIPTPLWLFVVSRPLPLPSHASKLKENQDLCMCIRELVFRRNHLAI